MTKTRRWALVLLPLALLLAVTGGVLVWSKQAKAEEIAQVEILGNRDLHATGDTSTLCGLVTLRNGTYGLGDTALKLVVDSASNVIGVKMRENVPARCAPLLRARGIVDSLPTVPLQWSPMAVHKPPESRV